ncbi:MAG TPA: rod-binding protein [Tepidisphaeraceae bacterium]|jgi:hypothetical protein|nr:rod-binding protein [Tepidisphaeraceae bacterium]
MHSAGSTSSIWSQPSHSDWRNLHGAVSMRSSQALANARDHLQAHANSSHAHPTAKTEQPTTKAAHTATKHLIGGAHAPLSRHEQLVKQTQKWVAQTFYGTMLKQMRDSPFKSKIFDGGRGGEAFGAMYDQQLAERMARGAGSKLVDTIVHHIEANAAAVKQRVNYPRKVM